MRLSAQGCVVPRIEILTYFVYAPFSIHETPYPAEHINLFNQDVKSRF
jgi:hypothetical protein